MVEKKRLEQAELAEDRRTKCAVCLVNNKNSIFMPCGHVCTCEECADAVVNTDGQCPMCRTDITGTNKAFFGGGKKLNYKDKYMKYKSKYLKLASNMDLY